VLVGRIMWCLFDKYVQENMGLLDVTADGTYIYHSALYC